MLTEAESDLDKQDYASAEALLKKYLERDGDNYAAWYDLGFADHQLGKRDDSIAAYRKSVSAKPDVFESNLNLGLALAESGDPQAEQFLRKATTLNPASKVTEGHMRAWLALGRLLEASKPDEAIAAFQQAAKLDPKNPEPLLDAGALLEKEQKAAEAEKQYQQALSIAPDSSDALIALSNLYMREKRFDDAQGPLRKLVALHPNDASAHFQLGRMLAIAGKNEDAATEMEAGLKLDPSDHKAQLRSPKMAVPTRTQVDPSSIAISKSWDMPIESNSMATLGSFRLAIRSRSSRGCRKYGRAPSGSSVNRGIVISP